VQALAAADRRLQMESTTAARNMRTSFPAISTTSTGTWFIGTRRLSAFALSSGFTMLHPNPTGLCWASGRPGLLPTRCD
jgi:hypothetical protein